MLNLPVRPQKKPAKRHNRFAKTAYFTDDGRMRLEHLARHMNRSISDTIATLVDKAYEALTTGAQ